MIQAVAGRLKPMDVQLAIVEFDVRKTLHFAFLRAAKGRAGQSPWGSLQQTVQ